MEPLNIVNQKNFKAEFNLKEITPIFAVFSLILSVLVFVFIKIELIPVEHYFSLENPSKLVVSTIMTSIGLIIFGIVLTVIMPAKFIDETNKTFQHDSLSTIMISMLFVVLFEELLFRGIIQNFIFLILKNEWYAIIVTALIFVIYHKRYFNKPLMLLNITLPSLVFCWIYFYHDNIIVPVIIHYTMNITLTLMFKYNLIRLRN